MSLIAFDQYILYVWEYKAETLALKCDNDDANIEYLFNREGPSAYVCELVKIQVFLPTASELTIPPWINHVQMVSSPALVEYTDLNRLLQWNVEK